MTDLAGGIPGQATLERNPGLTHAKIPVAWAPTMGSCRIVAGTRLLFELLTRCPCGELRSGTEPQLAEDVLDMSVHGPHRDHELAGDLAVRLPPSHPHDDL